MSHTVPRNVRACQCDSEAVVQAPRLGRRRHLRRPPTAVAQQPQPERRCPLRKLNIEVGGRFCRHARSASCRSIGSLRPFPCTHNATSSAAGGAATSSPTRALHKTPPPPFLLHTATREDQKLRRVALCRASIIESKARQVVSWKLNARLWKLNAKPWKVNARQWKAKERHGVRCDAAVSSRRGCGGLHRTIAPEISSFWQYQSSSSW